MSDLKHPNAKEKDDHGDKKHRKGHAARGHGGGSHEEPHEGAPEWLISFADNVTLMMGFFVILLAMNMKPTQTVGGGDEKPNDGQTNTRSEAEDDRLLDLAIAVREAFNNPVNIDSTNPADQVLIRRVLQRAAEGYSRQDGVIGEDHNVQSIRPSEYYAISGSVAFTEDSTVLSSAGRGTVDEIARRLRGRRVIAEVRGHVSAAEAQGDSDRAMALSFERAQAVARVLVENGADWWQLRLIACADNDRAEAFASTPQADQANARVEVIFTNEVTPDRVPTQRSQGRREEVKR